jgi:hypothetical protein
MSDQALAWKLAFGSLVLVFCGVSYFARDRGHPAELPTPAPAAAAAAPAPLPRFEAIPPDVADAPDEPETATQVPLPATKEPAPRHRKSARHVPPGKVHLVRHRAAASPYASGRKHYPFDPKERWRNGYA